MILETRISTILQDDLEEFLALNNPAVPNVNALDLATAQDILSQCFYARQVRVDNEMAGLLLVLEPGQPYQSPNYQWFSQRLAQFAYVDRIVISEQHRGLGLGKTLYQDLEAVCRQREIPRICCEVNLDPPNPGSSAFHARFGFESVGSQATEGGTKQVDLLIKELA